jgi:hypothetical protein
MFEKVLASLIGEMVVLYDDPKNPAGWAGKLAYNTERDSYSVNFLSFGSTRVEKIIVTNEKISIHLK